MNLIVIFIFWVTLGSPLPTWPCSIRTGEGNAALVPRVLQHGCAESQGALVELEVIGDTLRYLWDLPNQNRTIIGISWNVDNHLETLDADLIIPSGNRNTLWLCQTINGDLLWFNNGLTMVKNGMIMGYTRPGYVKQFAIENGPVEIVNCPMKNGWIFHSYVNVYRRVPVEGSIRNFSSGTLKN